MSKNPAEQFARLRLTLVCEMDSEGQNLLRHLQRTRAAVRHFWPPPERMGADCDVVLSEMMPGLGRRLSWMPGEPAAALIVLLPPAGHPDLQEMQAACADAALHRPYQSSAIDVALLLALDHFGLAKRQRQRIARMDENIRAMRDIEMAKHAIMAQRHVGEAEAFRILRDMAMQRQATIASVAAKFIDSQPDIT